MRTLLLSARRGLAVFCQISGVRIARSGILLIRLGIEHGEQGGALSGGILDSGITPAARGHRPAGMGGGVEAGLLMPRSKEIPSRYEE